MNASDERARAIHADAKEWKLDRAVLDQLFPLRWKSNGVIVQCVFFFLTCLALGAFYALFESGVFIAVVAIGLAELLIRRLRWFGTGVEQALWLGGVIAAVSELPRTNSKESVLVFAAAVALAGWRLRNPLFGAVAAVLAAVYFENFDRGALAGIVIGSLAMLALLRTWQRPSNEWLFVLIALVLPVAGYVMADARWREVTMLMYAAFGAVASVLALLKRHHALFLCGAIGIGIAASELARRIILPLEIELAIGGALLLGGSLLVARALRDRTKGFVMAPAKLTEADDALQIVATIAVAPPEHEISPAPHPEGGGSFGGAGATGEL